MESCRNFVKGDCMFGTACRKSHGKQTQEKFSFLQNEANLLACLETPMHLEHLLNFAKVDLTSVTRFLHSKWIESVISRCAQNKIEADFKSGRASVSFQFIVIPFLQLARKCCVQATVKKDVTWLLDTLHSASLNSMGLPAFESNVLQAAKGLIENRKHFREIQATPHLSFSTSTFEVLDLLFWFFDEMIQRYNNYAKFKNHVSLVTNVFQLASTIKFQPPLSEKEIEGLMSFGNRLLARQTQQVNAGHFLNPSPFPLKYVAVAPGQRHDNDKVDFRTIQVIPTILEMLSQEEEFIPRNQSNAYHPLIHDLERLATEDSGLYVELQSKGNAQQVLLDRLFRSSRLDFLLSMKLEYAFQPSIKVRLISVCSLPLSALLPTGYRISFSNSSIERGDLISIHNKAEVLLAFAYVVESTETFISISGLTLKSNLELGSTLFSKGTGTILVRKAFSGFFSIFPGLFALQEITALPFNGLLLGLNLKVSLPTNFAHRINARIDLNVLKSGLYSSLQSLQDVDIHGLKVDVEQFKAIATALHHQVALIQGPPGTGKSYSGALLVRILIDSVPEVCPILFLSTTNHALDQFVEDVLNVQGSTKEIRTMRLGRGSKKPEVMEEFSLFNWKRKLVPMPASHAKLKWHFSDECNVLDSLEAESPQWKQSIAFFIRYKVPNLFVAIQPREIVLPDEGFTQVSKKSNPLDLSSQDVNKWIQKGKLAEESFGFELSSDTPLSEINEIDFHKLSEGQRLHVLDVIRLIAFDSKLDSFNTLHQMVKENEDMRDIQAMKQMHFVAATTTKAMEIRKLIDTLQPKVIVCEEAGEILEIHNIATLASGSVQHLILIGDHMQLRPKVNYNPFTVASGCGYDFDVFLFERLASEGHPVQLLNAQRRMSPDISKYTRLTYPTLRDTGNVFSYPNVKGVQGNVLFFHHTEREDDQSESVSYSNTFEAKLILRFCSYLLRQGYLEIVVLTAYSEQLALLLNLAQTILKGQINFEVNELDLDQKEKEVQGWDTVVSKLPTVRFATVDNFQGEEGDVVLISTVRNNKQGKIGFLQDRNRVNVALSRARHGMYVFGNMKMLGASQSPLWQQICALAKQSKETNDRLTLVCQRHPDSITCVKHVKDFDSIRDGGCGAPCLFVLPCTHVCPNRCHPDDLLHEKIKCTSPCALTCERGHACKKQCFEPCVCTEVVPPVMLKCNHMSIKLLCCHDPDKFPCKVRIENTLLSCGHISKPYLCGTSLPPCATLCRTRMDCGHTCSLPHIECEARNHQHVCNRPCEIPNSCSHGCSRTCGHCDPCPDCPESEVLFSCTHSKSAPTRQNVSLCAEYTKPCPHSSCEWSCAHHKCLLSCVVPCDRPLCNERCSKLLACGHPCPSLCGEICPDPLHGCPVCGKHKSALQQLLFPFITLSCKHSFSVSQLDALMELPKYYSNDSPIPASLAFDAVRYRKCPICATTIVNVRRYSRLQKWLQAERRAFRFQRYVHRQCAVYVVEAQSICDSGISNERARHEANELISKVTAFQKSHRDPSVCIPDMPIDTTWESILNALVFACSFTSVESAQNVHGVISQEISEYVQLVYVTLTARFLSGLSQFVAAHKVFKTFFQSVSREKWKFKTCLESLWKINPVDAMREMLDQIPLDAPLWTGNAQRKMCLRHHMFAAPGDGSCPTCQMFA